MYACFFKRLIGFTLALMAIIILAPLMLVLTVLGRIIMKGNPFFVQPRPGKDEKVFNLIKFRSMTEEKDENGNYLPDEKRLTPYGMFLRKSSFDELPELFNILKGDMAIIGPRPLLVSYLPLYTKEEHHRHDVRPGLTGLAQMHGRNFLTWEEVFAYDLEYVNNITFINDLKIIIGTIKTVLFNADVEDRSKAYYKDGKLV
ncbi:MAG: sugar transferase, partial [Erysipelotrichaceae bacterium]|nr:sugar transferase [Erysipelotrichaceae bacterium]